MTERSKTTCQTNLNCDNVSQQILVGKQKFKCIINLNATFCPKKSKHKRKHSRKHSKYSGHRKRDQNNEEKSMNKEQEKKETPRKKGEHKTKEQHGHKYKQKSEDPIPHSSAQERTVPTCFRRPCWGFHERKKENIRRRNLQVQIDLHGEWNKRSLSKDKVKYEQKPSKHHHHHRHHHKPKHPRSKMKQTESRILLSPISTASLQHDLTYEDISSTSFKIYVGEKPTNKHRTSKSPKRNHVRQCKHKGTAQESKLDTLIRRTKERERKLVEKSRRDCKPWFSSTPIRNEYSSADFPMSCSDMEVSLNSVSTYVIGDKPYSPSSPTQDLQTPIEDLQNFETSETEKLCRRYSPSSPTRVYTPNVPKESDYKLLNVKNEPMMDIEAYSPTSTPKIKVKRECTEIQVKREIVWKTEPLFSCEISPIYFENETDNNFGEFCKIENVKSEFVDDCVD